MEQVLKDAQGRIIGKIKTEGNRKYLYSWDGRRLGYYENGYTYTWQGIRVGSGDLLTTLLMRI